MRICRNLLRKFIQSDIIIFNKGVVSTEGAVGFNMMEKLLVQPEMTRLICKKWVSFVFFYSAIYY